MADQIVAAGQSYRRVNGDLLHIRAIVDDYIVVYRVFKRRNSTWDYRTSDIDTMALQLELGHMRKARISSQNQAS